jgi:hypothetical protein
MSRHPHRNRIQACASQITDQLWRSDGRNKGQGSWPEGVGKLESALAEHSDGLGCREVCDMGDQGIETGPALGLIDRRHSQRVAGIGAQAIDRFGGQEDKGTVTEGLSGNL